MDHGPQRLDKLLAAAGLGSRKDVRHLIRAGRVQVDGVVVDDPSHRVRPAESRIEVDREPIVAGSVTMMLNKPQGVITATRDSQTRTVLDLFPADLARRLFPAGRLDKDTEGLLVLTDDGDLCHRLISPRHGVEKEYLASLDGPVPAALATLFAEGVLLEDGYKTRPARLVADPHDPSRARVTITEGKYHQVKRMFAANGLKVTALRRLRIGALHLDESLAPGAYRRLTNAELDLLFRDP